MNTVSLEFNSFTVRLTDPQDWALAMRLAGKVEDLGPGVFKYKLSIQNLEAVFGCFKHRNLQVVSGQRFLDDMRNKYREFQRARHTVQQITKLDRYPVPPNGKFAPYAHQTKIIGCIENSENTPVFADCFLPGTRVRQEGGQYLPIELATVNTEILTMYGKSHVEAAMARDYSGEVVGIATSAGFHPVWVTPDHKFYALKKERCVIPSRANTHCSNLCNRKCPIKKGSEPFNLYKIELVSARDITTNHALLLPKDCSDAEIKEYTDAKLKVYGYWLAEGWLVNDVRMGGVFGIAYGFNRSEESTLVEDLVQSLGLLGYSTNLEKVPSKPNVVTVYAYTKARELGLSMGTECGQFSDKKHLPIWFHSLSKRQKIVFLTALFRGDGCYKEKYDQEKSGKDTQRIRFTTVSYQLAVGVRDALASFGVRVQVYIEKAKIDKTGQRHKEVYRVNIPRRYTSLFGMDVCKKRQDLKQDHFENFTLTSISKIDRRAYTGKVYNLTSAGHDSYLTDAGFSKNCGTGKTGSTLRAIELELANKKISRGKVLVSAPLSILDTSWADDARSFTDLRVAMLWTKKTNKSLLGEKSVYKNHGPKPEGALTTKSKKKNKYIHNYNGMSQDRLTTLDDPKEWTRYEFSYKVAVLHDGEEVIFGEEFIRTTVKENTRENFIIEQLLRDDVDVYLINHDGVRIYEEQLKNHGFEWVVVDESTKIKSPSSKVFTAHVNISWKSKRRTVLTGTPNPNGFEDLWAQYYFLDRGLTLHTSMKDFLNDYFKPIKLGHFGGKDAVKWVMKSEADAKRLVDHVKAGAIFLNQRDCVDLPERINMRREVYMTAEQSKAYQEMEKELVAILRDANQIEHAAEAVNRLSQIMKLRQITSGFVVTDSNTGHTIHFNDNPKWDELDDVIEELGGKKLVVVCQFKEEIRAMEQRLSKYGGVGAVYGEEKLADRVDYIRSFQNADDIRFMILQPQAAAHGITLTKSPYMVFMSLDYNFEYYYQTGKRIERIGQKDRMIVWHMLARTADGQETVDHDLMAVLSHKEKDRDRLFKEENGTVEIANQLTQRLINRHK